MTYRLPDTSSVTSYVYASRRRRNCAANAKRDPTVCGLDVCHVTDLMFSYQRVALSGSMAYAATVSRGTSISIWVLTSTLMTRLLSMMDTWGSSCPRQPQPSDREFSPSRPRVMTSSRQEVAGGTTRDGLPGH